MIWILFQLPSHLILQPLLQKIEIRSVGLKPDLLSNFVKAVLELSDFTAEKEFKAIWIVLWKYDGVFFDFIFGETANWRSLYDRGCLGDVAYFILSIWTVNNTYFLVIFMLSI